MHLLAALCAAERIAWRRRVVTIAAAVRATAIKVREDGSDTRKNTGQVHYVLPGSRTTEEGVSMGRKSPTDPAEWAGELREAISERSSGHSAGSAGRTPGFPPLGRWTQLTRAGIQRVPGTRDALRHRGAHHIE